MDFQATILVAAQTLALSSPGGGGDFFRWIPATMYFVSAVFCLLAGLAERSVGNRRASPHTGVTEFRAEQPPLARNPGPRFWWPLASFLFLFGIERAFDLLSMLTDYGRGNAVAHAWYGSRRTYQGAFISAVVVLGAVPVSYTHLTLPTNSRV